MLVLHDRHADHHPASVAGRFKQDLIPPEESSERNEKENFVSIFSLTEWLWGGRNFAYKIQNAKPGIDHPHSLAAPWRKDLVMKPLGAAHKNLDAKVYSRLKAMILERKLLPGEKIPQEKVAQELGISRTPLVSALKYLEKEKLVESRPRRGFFVRLFTKQEMIAIFELREVLEGLAARRAALSISDREIKQLQGFFQSFQDQTKIQDIKAYAEEDRRFHHFLLDIGAKEFLKSILETYNIIIYSYQVISPEGLVQSPDESIQDHIAVIEAVCRRNAESAETLMRRHLRKSITILRQNLAKGARSPMNREIS
jgi:DNA-binding GntR family transcriptional regulator